MFIRTKDNRILAKDYCQQLYGFKWVEENTVKEAEEIKDLCNAFEVRFSNAEIESRFFPSLESALKFYNTINHNQYSSNILGLIFDDNDKEYEVVEFFGNGTPEIISSEYSTSLYKNAHFTKLNEDMIPVKEELYDYLVKNVIRQVFEVDGKYYISIYDNSPWLYATEIDKEHYEGLKKNGVKDLSD